MVFRIFGDPLVQCKGCNGACVWLCLELPGSVCLELNLGREQARDAAQLMGCTISFLRLFLDALPPPLALLCAAKQYGDTLELEEKEV